MFVSKVKLRPIALKTSNSIQFSAPCVGMISFGKNGTAYLMLRPTT